MATTGQAAKRLGVDRKTIIDWIEHEGLSQFFSDSARKKHGSAHRQLTDADMLALNTIRHLRNVQEVSDWSVIGEYLNSGKREAEYPQSRLTMDTTTVTLPEAEQSVRAAATMAERDTALARIDELQDEIERMRSEHKQETDALHKRIEDLQRELGRTEAKLEILQERDNNT